MYNTVIKGKKQITIIWGEPDSLEKYLIAAKNLLAQYQQVTPNRSARNEAYRKELEKILNLDSKKFSVVCKAQQIKNLFENITNPNTGVRPVGKWNKHESFLYKLADSGLVEYQKTLLKEEISALKITQKQKDIILYEVVEKNRQQQEKIIELTAANADHIRQAEKSISTLKADFNKKLAQQASIYEKKLAKQTQKKVSAIENIKKINAKLTALRKQNEQLTSEAKALEEKLQQLSLSEKALTEELKHKKAQPVLPQIDYSEISRLNRQISSLETKINVLKSEQQDLNRKLRTNKASNAQLKEKNEYLMAESRKQQNNLRKKAKETGDLNAQLALQAIKINSLEIAHHRENNKPAKKAEEDFSLARHEKNRSYASPIRQLENWIYSILKKYKITLSLQEKQTTATLMAEIEQAAFTKPLTSSPATSLTQSLEQAKLLRPTIKRVFIKLCQS